METVSARPTSITVISWVWIIMGGLMILSGLMGFFSYTMMHEISGGQAFPPQLPPNAPPALSPMIFIFSHFQIIAAFQVFFAIVAIISGAMFLQLRSWARSVLEVLTWLSLTYLVVFCIYWVYIWISMTGHIPQDQMQPGMAYFTYFGIVMAVVINLIFGAPLVIMLIKLRSSTVKHAVY